MTHPEGTHPVTDAHDTVDLFAGPGGLDVAARRLGLHPIGIEWSPDACATRRAAGLATIEDDVRRYGPADFPHAKRLMGGPPCQSFTVAGNGKGRRDLDTVLALANRLALREDISLALHLLDKTDPRTSLVLEPLRWALDAVDLGRPFRTIVLEQVQAVLPVWRAYAEHLAAEGYRTATGVLHTEQHGVPQTRKRAVLIATLDGTATLPAPTHQPYRPGQQHPDNDPHLAPWVSMGEVLDRPGPFTVVSNYGTGGDPKARGRRLSTQPSATVTGKVNRCRIYAPDGTELPRLTNAEAGQLQTFPADYPWSGGDIPQQIGNAVPVLLGEHVIAAAIGAPTPATLTVAA
jgi:DNA (cytosine-5)-methyltransferase 1